MRGIALALILFASGLAHAQEAQLHITGGEAITVKIDKVVIVKEDRLVVRALPFKLVATAGAADYRWVVPAGVTATEADDILTVTAAPKGELSVSCRVLIVDFEKKITKRTTESLTFNVGDVPPPTPPAPPNPPAPSALQQALQAAYDADLDSDKGAKVAKFASVLEGAVAAAKQSGKIRTAAEFTSLIHAATELAIGPVTTSIPTVRRAVATYLQTVLPREPSTPANDAYYARVSSEFGFVSLVLRGLK